MLIGEALANALAFTGSSYLFLRLYRDNIEAERKRHDLAIEQLQKAQIKWMRKRQERINFINEELSLEQRQKPISQKLNNAMRGYHEVFGHELPLLPREPVLSDYYTPSSEQHDKELGYIGLGMVGNGRVLYYILNVES